MITSLTLTNWQIHESLHLGLESVTVLTGENDSGKTAVIRALKFLALNEWDGGPNEFVTWGQESAEVSAVVDERTVRRVKGEKENSYFLDKQEYKAFRGTVPEPVAKTLNITHDNFQEQHDPAYWLCLNSGQAASALNEIFSLTDIDDALERIATDLRRTRSEQTVSRSRLEQAEKAKKETDWVVEADKKLRTLESLWKEIQVLEVELIRLNNLLTEVVNLRARMNRTADTLGLKEKMVSVGDSVYQLDLVIERAQEKMQWMQDAIDLGTILKEKQAKLAETLSGTCPLCGRGDK